MLYAFTVLALAALAAPVAALSGKATTTRYYDGQEGACGCGSSSGLFQWQTGLGGNIYTAAGSQALFDAGGSSWCGSGCGTCYELTSTGTAPAGQGTGGTPDQNITVMITNLCPNNGNAQWCPQPGQKNEYGYEYHFDIMANSALAPIIGDNPIVSFESVPCPGVATTDYDQCVCKAGSGSGSGTGSGSGSSAAPSPSTTDSPSSGKTGTGTGPTTAPSPSTSPGTSGGSGSGSCSSSSGKAAQYAQCGGNGFTGATKCVSPYTCKVQNEWYSQCL